MSQINYEKLPTGGGGTVGTLQQVTDLGNTTTNNVIISNNSLFIANGNLNIGSVSGNDQIIMSHGIGAFPTANLKWVNGTNRAELTMYADTGQTKIGATKTSGSITLDLPDINGTLAPYTDTNGNLNYAGFFINSGSVWGNLSFDGSQGQLELVSAGAQPTTITSAASAPRTQTLPNESGEIALKKFDEYNTTLSQNTSNNPSVSGDEINTNAGVTTTFTRVSSGIYEATLSQSTTKIVATASAAAALTTGNPYVVTIKKTSATVVQFTVFDLVGVPTDNWEFLNLNIKYTL